MRVEGYLVLFLAGLVVLGLVAVYQTSPGYVDDAYYYATAVRIVKGKGFTEPFLWNYLGGFPEITHPSHAFWMPLSTLVAALGMATARTTQFWAAKIPFVLLGASVPPLTAALGHSLYRDRRVSWLAGTFAVFSGFYLPYLGTTDSFSLTMVLGALFFYISSKMLTERRLLLWGVIAGGLHLVRAEGVLWLGVALLILFFQEKQSSFRWGYLLLGYLMIMGPWLVRNWIVFGSFSGPGGLQTLWMTEYEQLFLYPPTELNWRQWWREGAASLLEDRLWASGVNLTTTLAVEGGIFLLPLIIWGGWSLWDDSRVKAGAAGWGGLLVMMSLVFPFPGARGSFFHGGAVLQPLGWALAAVGLQKLTQWGQERRGWKPVQAWRVLAVGFVIILGVLSYSITVNRVIGGQWQQAAWNQSARVYRGVEEQLQELGAAQQAAVMVNDPAGYYAQNRRKAVVVPAGGLEGLQQAARQYEIDYLILEENHPRALERYYQQAGNLPGFRYLLTYQRVHIYERKDIQGP